jgi:hypothetical protein
MRRRSSAEAEDVGAVGVRGRAAVEPEVRSDAIGGLRIAHVWMVIAVATPLIIEFMGRMPAADLAYQVRAGDIMWRTHAVLRTDVFTFTVPGAPWLNQQWGAQVLLSAVHRVGGWNGIALLHAGLASAAFAFVFLACRRRGASARAAALLSVAGFWVARQNLAMRPQLIGVLLFSVTLWIVAGRRSHPKALWIVPALVLIWVNVHGSFVLAPVLLGLAWLEDRRDAPATARIDVTVGAACLLATLVNPFGLRVWSYAMGIGTNSTIGRTVTEWAPPTIREYSGVVFFASVSVVAGYLIRRREPVTWPTLYWLAAFLVLALPALRGVVWWGLVFPVVIARLMARKPDADSDRGSPTMNAVLIAAIVVVAIVLMPVWRTPSPAGSPPTLAQAPASLVEVADAALEPGSRLFVSQTYASWFEYALPSMPVFVDSRIELFPTTLWDDYLAVGGAREGWQSVLDRWDVDAVVVNPDQDEQLLAHIADDPGWRLVFEDDSGSVFVRS